MCNAPSGFLLKETIMIAAQYLHTETVITMLFVRETTKRGMIK